MNSGPSSYGDLQIQTIPCPTRAEVFRIVRGRKVLLGTVERQENPRGLYKPDFVAFDLQGREVGRYGRRLDAAVALGDRADGRI